MNTDTSKSNIYTKGKLTQKQLRIAGGILVLLLALIVGIGIYNTPANRLTRQLDLGNRYLEEQNYEQAAIAFEEAIAIDDRCIEAYAGGVLAYQQLGDQESLTDIYERALSAVSGLDEAELAENMETVVGIYLTAEEVYSGNPARVIEILENGFSRTEDQRIKDRLVGCCLELAKGYADVGDYENAMDIYDRLLELDKTNAEVQSAIGNCLEKYLELLIDQERYDEAKALIEKYQDKVFTVDFQSYLDRIAELEQTEDENSAFMKKIYDLMATEDYEAMSGVDGSRESEAFVARMTEAGEESYIYLPEEGTMTGTGAGIYRNGDGGEGYYFYYGNYIAGSREGEGVSFSNDYRGGYEVFTGSWKNDAPNGEGMIEKFNGAAIDGESFYSVKSGNLVNGLWDGFVNYKLYDSGNTFDLSYTAVNGIPQEDKTDEYIDLYGHVDLEEGAKIIAFDCVGDIKWWQGSLPGQKTGVAGFTD